MKRREFFKSATIFTATAFSTFAESASTANNSADIPSMNDQITALSASALSLAIREREISCNEVMTAYLERIHRFNPTYNAIVSLANDDTLLEEAKAADKALSKGEYWGWMHGMPHAVKDLADGDLFRRLGLHYFPGL